MTTELDLAPFLGEESKPIEFPAGLIGLEEWRHFAIISHPAGEPLRLLKSLEDQRVSLIVTDPRHFLPEYRFTLSEADARALGLASPANQTGLGLYCILSVTEEPFSVTANLVGPLVINWEAGLGQQLILSDTKYALRHPLVSQAEPQPAASLVGQGQEA